MDFNRILKNRTVLGISCIVVSFLICFGLAPLFNSGLKARTEIIRVTKNIKMGEGISTGKVEKVMVGAYNLPEGVVKNIDELKNRYAAFDLVKGDYILSSKLTDNPYKEDGYLYKLDGKKEAISVSIKNFALGLSGKLKQGDIVSIIASDYGEMRKTLIPPELQYVEVLAVTTAKGMDEDTTEKDPKNNDEEKQLPSTVTLLADSTQAKVLAELEENSKIHMTLVYRGNSDTAKKFLQAQDEVLKNQGSGDITQQTRQSGISQTSSSQGGKQNAR